MVKRCFKMKVRGQEICLQVVFRARWSLEVQREWTCKLLPYDSSFRRLKIGLDRENIKMSYLFTKINYIQILINMFAYFFVVFQVYHKKTHSHLANICPIFSLWTPIWNHFAHFWMMSVPKQPGLKLKSVLEHECIKSLLKNIVLFGKANCHDKMESKNQKRLKLSIHCE